MSSRGVVLSWQLFATPDGRHFKKVHHRFTGAQARHFNDFDDVHECIEGKWGPPRRRPLPPGAKKVTEGRDTAGHDWCLICADEV